MPYPVLSRAEDFELCDESLCVNLLTLRDFAHEKACGLQKCAEVGTAYPLQNRA